MTDESTKDRERREKAFREATEYHLLHALRLIDRTPVDLYSGRVDSRKKGDTTTYTFRGDPILEITCEESVTPLNPDDRFPIGPIHNKTLRFNHLKGEPPAPFVFRG